MGDDQTEPPGAGSEPTSGLPPAPAPDVTRATSPGVSDAPSSPAPRGDVLPARIGRYAVVRVLGEGGMGTVYEAQQENPKRTVALKVIRAGYLSPELLRRFGQESQVLGRLQHPGIAQVYEAGTVKDERGRHDLPFFAMEFIKGVPLTEYVAKKHLGTRDRLELVAKICDAVYHAHQKGVIHRDLKPGNILVDESGQPKILDFGVARATDSDIQQTTMQTDIGQLIGTVPYMSPEQVSGDPNDLDTRSDVYALGVIAYELLAGRLPYNLQKKMIHEAARIIREEEPTRLSGINRTLRGDVETIVAKALEKDKARRYQSAESLASDIRRYLTDEPITARPASTWYQLQKFSRRNTGLVVAVSAAFLLLVAGLIGTSYGLKEAVKARDNEAEARKDADAQKDAAIAARKDADVQKTAAIAAKDAEEVQRKEAESQRDQAEITADFMADTLQGASPSIALGRDTTMLKEMMDAAAARIEKGELAAAPETELRLRRYIGITYRLMSVYDAAQRMFEPTEALARSIPGLNRKVMSNTLNDLALLREDLGDLAGAERLLRESLEMKRRLWQGDNADLAGAVANMARLLKARGDLGAAEPLYRESLEMMRRIYPGDHRDVALLLNLMAGLLQARGDPAGAEKYYRESLEMRERLFPGGHPEVATAMSNLGLLLRDSGKLDEAEPLLRDSLEMKRRFYSGDHTELAAGLTNLALLLRSRDDLAGAEPLFREALDMFRRLFPGDNPSVATGLSNMAGVLKERGDLDGAEPLARESLEMKKRLFPGDHPDVAVSLISLGGVLKDRGDLAGAEPLYREALDILKRRFPGDHPRVAIALNNLGNLLKARGDLDGAEPLLRESLEMRRRLSPGGNPSVAIALGNLASLLKERGNLAGAEPLYREALEIRKRALGQDHGDTLNALYNLAGLLIASGQHAEAAPLVDECIEKRTRKFGTAHDETREALAQAVTLYESWDKAEPGKGYDVKAAEWKAKLDALPPAPEAKTDGKK